MATCKRTTIIGREHTRRKAFDWTDEFGNSGRLEELDPEDSFNVGKIKARALHVLRDAGFLPSDMYGPHGECLALERVRLADHDDDSPLGLAASILQSCRELELCAESDPKEVYRYALLHAYAIGRKVILCKAYLSKSEQTSTATTKRDRNYIETKHGKTTKKQLVADAIKAAGADTSANEIWTQLIGNLDLAGMRPVESGAKDARRIDCGLDDGREVSLQFSHLKAMVSREKRALGLSARRGRPKGK